MNKQDIIIYGWTFFLKQNFGEFKSEEIKINY